MSWLRNLEAGFIIPRVLKGIAEGKYGSAAQWLYLHLNGLITIIGVAFGIAAGVIGVLDHYGVCALVLAHWAWFDCAKWTVMITKGSAGLAAFCIWIGQINGGVKIDPPDPRRLPEALSSLRSTARLVVFLILAIGASVGTAHAQVGFSDASWTSATAADTAVSLSSRGGDVHVALAVTPPLTAGQLNFESSADNVTWFATRCLRAGVSTTPESSFALNGASSTLWTCPGSGLYMRVRLNPQITGAGTAAIRVLAGQASSLGIPLSSADGAVYVRNYSPTLWTCTLVALANTLTQCVAAPAAGLRHYITDVTVQTTTATSGQYAVQTGTGSNCGTGTTPIFPSSNTADRWNAPINTSASDTKNFTTPLKPTAANAICAIGTATNTVTIQLQGYDAP